MLIVGLIRPHQRGDAAEHLLTVVAYLLVHAKGYASHTHIGS